ncbi:MAG TPA: prepilin-type N-terminal cleavage/methylation domain-containing protein [bacterium]
MRRLRLLADQHGVSLIELIVAAGIFALLFLAIDSVFIGAHRSTQQAELTADVDQNARIALERLTREVREGRASQIVCTPGGCGGGATGAVAFRSARSGSALEDSRIFCVSVPGNTDRFYNAGCDYYGGPPVAGVQDYTPVWQRIIGYRLVATGGATACGPYELHRYVIDLTAPTTPALPANPSNPGAVGLDAVVASCIQDFQVSVVPQGSRNRFLVTLKGRGQRAAQGGVPPQEILLNGEAWIRND